MVRLITNSFFLLAGALSLMSWGFFAHKQINRVAVFSLPPEMVDFYKYHIQYITEKAVNPDKRRYVNPDEAPRHYIDLDVYGDSALYKMPRFWDEAVEKYTEDTLKAYGIVPWYVNLVEHRLTQAFAEKNVDRILRHSADLGHYIGDAHVPLHTTENYNGQRTGQHGIHGFWESRLPELFFEDYDLFVGKATYIRDTQHAAWRAVESAHHALDSVLQIERLLNEKYPNDKKYSYEERGSGTVRVYSYDYSEGYHRALNGMVERQMRKAIKMTADFWYTAWVDAGQPDLTKLLKKPGEEEKIISGKKPEKLRDHESGEPLSGNR